MNLHKNVNILRMKRQILKYLKKVTIMLFKNSSFFHALLILESKMLKCVKKGESDF